MPCHDQTVASPEPLPFDASRWFDAQLCIDFQNCTILSALVQTAHAWMWQLDPALQFTASGSGIHDLLGYQPEEVMGRSFFKLVLEEEIPRVRTQIEQLRIPMSKPREIHMIKLACDGRAMRSSSVVSRLSTPNGRFQGYWGIETDWRQANCLNTAALQRAFTHDMNNLLAVIAGQTELLDDASHQDPGESISIIRQFARKASLLNGELQLFSRMEQSAKLLDIGTIVENASALLRCLLAKSIELELESEPLPVSFITDPHRIHALFFLLAMNAREALAWPATLHIRLGYRWLENKLPPNCVPGHNLSIEVSATSRADGQGREPPPVPRRLEYGVASLLAPYGGTLLLDPSRDTGLRILLPIACSAIKNGSSNAATAENKTF